MCLPSKARSALHKLPIGGHTLDSCSRIPHIAQLQNWHQSSAQHRDISGFPHTTCTTLHRWYFGAHSPACTLVFGSQTNEFIEIRDRPWCCLADVQEALCVTFRLRGIASSVRLRTSSKAGVLGLQHPGIMTDVNMKTEPASAQGQSVNGASIAPQNAQSTPLEVSCCIVHADMQVHWYPSDTWFTFHHLHAGRQSREDSAQHTCSSQHSSYACAPVLGGNSCAHINARLGSNCERTP